MSKENNLYYYVIYGRSSKDFFGKPWHFVENIGTAKIFKTISSAKASMTKARNWRLKTPNSPNANKDLVILKLEVKPIEVIEYDRK